MAHFNYFNSIDDDDAMMKNIDPDGWIPYMGPVFVICCLLVAWMAWRLNE